MHWLKIKSNSRSKIKLLGIVSYRRIRKSINYQNKCFVRRVTMIVIDYHWLRMLTRRVLKLSSVRMDKLLIIMHNIINNYLKELKLFENTNRIRSKPSIDK